MNKKQSKMSHFCKIVWFTAIFSSCFSWSKFILGQPKAQAQIILKFVLFIQKILAFASQKVWLPAYICPTSFQAIISKRLRAFKTKLQRLRAYKQHPLSLVFVIFVIFILTKLICDLYNIHKASKRLFFIVYKFFADRKGEGGVKKKWKGIEMNWAVGNWEAKNWIVNIQI